MTVFLFANNAHTTLAGPIAATATTINLAAGTGSLFPVPGVGQQFAMTLTSQSNTNIKEIVYVTTRATDVVTVVRAQEGTTALAFIAGDFADNYLTAGTTAAFTQATQLQQQSGNYAVDTGTVNNIAVTFTPAPASLAQLVGVHLRIKVANTNTSGVTIAVNGLAATVLVNTDQGTMDAGRVTAGSVIMVLYDGVHFQLLAYSVLSHNNVWAGTTNAFQNITATSVVATALNGTSGIIGGVTLAGGNVNAPTGSLQAGFGAFGTGIPGIATLLKDFLTEGTATRFPNGYLVQCFNATIPIDGQAHLYNLPYAYTSTNATAIVSSGAFSPQPGCMVGAQLANAAQVYITGVSATYTGNLGVNLIVAGF